jgi:shikimate dehydrogenase
MKLFGLIGASLSHSFSKDYFNQKFSLSNIEAEYKNFELKHISDIISLVKDNPTLSGLNITIPFKQKIIPYLDKLDVIASKTGSVNTVQIFRNNEQFELHGFNTDYFGFEKSFMPLINQFGGTVLILGTGGVSQTIACIFNEADINYYFVSRTKSDKNHIIYYNLTEPVFSHSKVIVNCTPLGMFPNIESCPDIPYYLIDNSYLLIDLIYNPSKTLFLKKGEEQGAIVKNGLEMLTLQAEKAWEIWNQ